ncbi:MAG: hypothetical protein IMHGJWDQ_001308 [Candidatus Fervidibacter sp.]
MGALSMSVKSFLRRLSRLLFVTNPAAFWLLLREGKEMAISYLYQVWTIYLWRKFLYMREDVPCLLPEGTVSEMFPDVDLTQVTLLFPLPRPGGVQTHELALLVAIVRTLQPKRLVEIGTAEGRTTINLALHSPPDAEIITLDLPPDAPGSSPESGADYRQMGIPEPGVLFRNHPLAAKIRLLLADSTKFDWSPYERSVDFVFIDGAHDYESVRKDTENALRIVREGGIILWHDYSIFKGVTLCLNELRQRLPVVWIQGTTLACYRFVK